MIFVSVNVYCQNIDTSILVRNIKILLIKDFECGLMNKNCLDDFINRPLQFKILPSKGFNSIIFFKIPTQTLYKDSLSVKGKILIKNTPICLEKVECYFVVSYNVSTKQIYKLKGGVSNDFLEFYNSLETNWIYWKPLSKLNKRLKTQFLIDYNVSELDLGCLINSFIDKKTACYEPFSRPLIVR
jgi:hypothetical protein